MVWNVECRRSKLHTIVRAFLFFLLQHGAECGMSKVQVTQDSESVLTTAWCGMWNFKGPSYTTYCTKNHVANYSLVTIIRLS